MDRKLVALMLLTVSMLFIAPFARAQEPPTLAVWTDKAEYMSGESGTLYFAMYNDGDSAFTIKKITVVFDQWRAYRNGQWEGNQTIEINPPVAVASKGNPYENNTRFTVPTDGRAKTTTVHITFFTVETGASSPYSHSITVTQTPRFMDQIVTLFTIQVVLIIVCTVIIAATIFLSARRPQVAWSKETQ